MISGEQVNYQDDLLNRLMQAVTSDNPNVTQWGQSFTYDSFGNLSQKNVIKNQAPSLSVIVDPATNRVTQQGGSAISYDANGNPTVAYGPNGAMSLSYGGQNRLIKAGNDSYAYDLQDGPAWGRLLSLNDQNPFLDVMIQTVHPRTQAETVALSRLNIP